MGLFNLFVFLVLYSYCTQEYLYSLGTVSPQPHLPPPCLEREIARTSEAWAHKNEALERFLKISNSLFFRDLVLIFLRKLAAWGLFLHDYFFYLDTSSFAGYFISQE